MKQYRDPDSDEARAAFMDALKSIPNEEKASYLRAQSLSPELLERESSVSRFLRYERGDPHAAATRFVGYWKKRASVFGYNRAYLPMGLSDGSLSESCKALIRAGLVAVLPPDMDGKSVFFLDMTIQEIRHPDCHEDRLHCMFYALQVVSEEISSQTQGITLIILYDDHCYAPNMTIEGLENILCSMPIRVADLHLIPVLKILDQASFFQEFVPRVLMTVLSPNQTGHLNVLQYIDESHGQVMSKLERRGLRWQNLPSKIGGGWTGEHHNAWMRSRLAKEKEIREKDVQGVSFPGSDDTTGAPLSLADRKRRQETEHCKQKRDRKSCRMKAVCLHIEHLEKKKNDARLVQQRLEDGLAEARKIVKKIESHDATGMKFFLGPHNFPQPQAPSSGYGLATPFLHPHPLAPHFLPPYQWAGSFPASAPIKITIILPGNPLPIPHSMQPPIPTQTPQSAEKGAATQNRAIRTQTQPAPSTDTQQRAQTTPAPSTHAQLAARVAPASMYPVDSRVYGGPWFNPTLSGVPVPNLVPGPPDPSNAHFPQASMRVRHWMTSTSVHRNNMSQFSVYRVVLFALDFVLCLLISMSYGSA
eukprot:scaffold36103_cov176-Amphora_coffeaeformis.AAC.1